MITCNLSQSAVWRRSLIAPLHVHIIGVIILCTLRFLIVPILLHVMIATVLFFNKVSFCPSMLYFQLCNSRPTVPRQVLTVLLQSLPQQCCVRYPKVCYSMLKVLNERCRIIWASHIRFLLESNGFSFVWISLCI